MNIIMTQIKKYKGTMNIEVIVGWRPTPRLQQEPFSARYMKPTGGVSSQNICVTTRA